MKDPHQGGIVAPRGFPPEAQSILAKHASTLVELPPVLAASLLREIRSYDWQFPAERVALVGQLEVLRDAHSPETKAVLEEFAALPLPQGTDALAWREPEAFLERFTANLWLAGANESFRRCANEYGKILTAIAERSSSDTNRLVIVLIGRDAKPPEFPLFQKLRQRGTYFSNVDTANAVAGALQMLGLRASPATTEFDHWYVDGATTKEASRQKGISHFSFDELREVRTSLAGRVRAQIATENMGPEGARSYMMRMTPEEVNGFPLSQGPVLRHFAMRVLCDGSGTQNLSTSFVQWSSREILRRAQPATLVARYGPRSNSVDFLAGDTASAGLNAQGALLDGDIGAFYTWLHLERTPGKGTRTFIVLLEGGREAVVVAPGMPSNSTVTKAATLSQLLRWSGV
jgi:hypothetical protein